MKVGKQLRSVLPENYNCRLIPMRKSQRRDIAFGISSQRGGVSLVLAVVANESSLLKQHDHRSYPRTSGT
jgi:hypothetical protein